MELYLCEKPSQARDLARVLKVTQRGDGYFFNDKVAVTYAIGHLLETAEPVAYGEQYGMPWRIDALPVVPNVWQMDVVERTKGQFRVVKDLLKQVDTVIIATDADREGEVIARELLDRVRYTGSIRRLWVSDSTDAGIKRALGNMRRGDEYVSLYASGLGRQRSDWLAGMNMTMALTACFQRGKGYLPFGRVQTPTLYLVVRRERAIASFVPKTHYQIRASFRLGNAANAVPMHWITPKALLDTEGHVIDQTAVQRVAESVRNQSGSVTSLNRTQERSKAPLLYYLGGIQKDASNRFGLSPKDTLAIVQALYEKHKLVTYPRTDCEYISEEMYADVPKVLAALKLVDPEFAPTIGGIESAWRQRGADAKAHRAFNTAKVAASAHHAIVPTSASAQSIDALNANERKVYDLIRRRYLAQFAGDYEYDQTVVEIEVKGERFMATGKTPTALGWTALYESSGATKKRRNTDDADGDAEEEVTLPPVKIGDSAKNVSADVRVAKTKPPKRYTQATLLAAMESIDKEIHDPRLATIMKNKEKAGIGTDATRADILEKLLRTELLEVDGKTLVATPKGTQLIATLEKVCPDTVDLALTAIWEDRLTQVEQGKADLASFERGIAEFVSAQVERIKQAAKTAAPALQTRTEVAPSGERHQCPSCDGAMRLRGGVRGAFWGCSNYPRCNATLPDDNGKPGKPSSRSAGPSSASTARSPLPNVGATCPACSTGKVTTKTGRYGGVFLTCTNYEGGCRYFVSAEPPKAARPT